MALRGLLKTTCRLLWFTTRCLDRLLVCERFFEPNPDVAHTAKCGEQCLQAASVDFLGCLGKKFFQFWALPATEAEFHYPGTASASSGRASHPPACLGVHPIRQ
jgi:hypothetical protein